MDNWTEGKCLAQIPFFIIIASPIAFVFLRITFKSIANQGVVNRLVREVKGLNPEYSTEQIQGKMHAVIHVFIDKFILYTLSI